MSRDSESPDGGAYVTGYSTPDTPPSQYRTATATLSAAFASIWGSYQQQLQPPSQKMQAGETVDTGNPPSSTPSSPRSGPRGRQRGAIPFDMATQVEAPPRDSSRTSSLATSPALQPSSLRSVFDSSSAEQTAVLNAAEAVKARPTRGKADTIGPAPASPSASTRSQQSAVSAAYSTLSRFRVKPSRAGLGLGGSGFLWGSSSATLDTAAKAATDWEETLQKQERVDHHVRRIVFQAGLDYETRPMVVIAACYLPDPKEVDYDSLFDRLLSTLDLFAENDYTVVLMANGGRFSPSWNWLWKAYRRLGRKFRKNLKKLYIVHPTLFTRSLMKFIQTSAYLVSPKFPKKVTTVNTLSQLAEHIPITQIDIPPEVLQVNLRLEPTIVLPEGRGGGALTRVFGVDLVQLMGEQGEKGGVPKVVRDCVDAILGTVNGVQPLEVEGIFRRSPSTAMLTAAKESYDRGHPVNLTNYSDPNIPAVLLKMFFRSLPRPIFPQSFYPIIRACPQPPWMGAKGDFGGDARAQQAAAQETIHYIREVLLPAIDPPSAVILLSYTLGLLHRVAQHAELNKMDASNLATVFSPNLVGSGNAVRDMLVCRVDGVKSMSSGPASPQVAQKALKPQQPTALGLITDASAIDQHWSAEEERKKTALGSVIRFCIEHYYEIFDETEFGPRIERAQQLVDEISGVPTSASVLTFHSAQDGSPSSPRSPTSPTSPRRMREGLPRFGDGTFHRRLGSASSSASGLSQPNSPFNLAFTPSRARLSPPISHGDAADTPSLHNSKSITSREFRGLGTLGRNSAGSLRLTKRSLKSGNGAGSGGHGRSGSRDENLTGVLSGVTITGANAAGYFSSPVSAASDARRQDSGSSTQESPSSPTSFSPKGSPTPCTSPLEAMSTPMTANSSDESLSKTVLNRRRSTDVRNQRRELSEVKEDSEA